MYSKGYFREHAESWVERYAPREAGPQLILHGYLHRVVNSGGRIEREYAVGRGRIDVLIEWRQTTSEGAARTRKYVIECKVRTATVGLERLIRTGLEQTAAYMDGCGAEAGHLVIFDPREGQSWEDRVFRRDPEPGEPPITVWGTVAPTGHPWTFDPEPVARCAIVAPLIASVVGTGSIVRPSRIRTDANRSA